MWKTINNYLYNNKLKNKKDYDFYKDLEIMENFIGYISESSVEKNINSNNYNFDDITETENYKILNNLLIIIKKYLHENQKLLDFEKGILSKFKKNNNNNNNYIDCKLIEYNLNKCWLDEAISYLKKDNYYINFELLKKILKIFNESNIIFNDITFFDKQLINNYTYTNDLEKEINKNISNFDSILKRIFYGLIKCNKIFIKSSFYNLINFKIINKILIAINQELISKYIDIYSTNKLEKDISTYIAIDLENDISYEDQISKMNIISSENHFSDFV